ncbi:MAG TPA: T9SS type A sorting domain-containing protein [Ignavibacteria bacterium]|nr:T9SS type A sorting domain-containing protein [Ignavibacteria bacterium]HMR42047.1 T9SS type A sorting domain-containing protein [Ignavibacteria bacterium]
MFLDIRFRKSKNPESISLKQNSPNPFNPVTDMEFKISNKEIVSLKVYDISGKEVATIVNKELTPGIYIFSFDASGLTSGMYLYTLKSNERSITKKMLLLK